MEKDPKGREEGGCLPIFLLLAFAILCELLFRLVMSLLGWEEPPGGWPREP